MIAKLSKWLTSNQTKRSNFYYNCFLSYTVKFNFPLKIAKIDFLSNVYSDKPKYLKKHIQAHVKVMVESNLFKTTFEMGTNG